MMNNHRRNKNLRQYQVARAEYLRQNYNEMSQISQLTDSSFGNSHSTNNNFTDNNIPLRQPSASMTTHSSSSTAGQQRYNNLYGQRKNLTTSFDGIAGTRLGSNHFRDNTNTTPSGELKMKSLLGKNRQAKAMKQKPNFGRASPRTSNGESRNFGGNLSMNQPSYETVSSSFSASALALNYNNNNNDHQKRRKHQQCNHKVTFDNRRGMGAGEYVNCGMTNHGKDVLTNLCRNNKRSSPMALLLHDPTFAKAATPRKRCIIQYPLLNYEKKSRLNSPEHQHKYQQQQNQKMNENHKLKEATSIAQSKQIEELKQEPCTYPHNKGDIDIDTNIRGTINGCDINQQYMYCDKENNEKMSVHETKGKLGLDPTDATPTCEDMSGCSSSQHLTATNTNVARKNDSESFISLNNKQNLKKEIEINEMKKKQGMKNIETQFFVEVQKQLEDKQLEFFTKLKSEVASLEEKTRQKATQECEAIANATENALNQQVASIQKATLLKIDQKQDEVEKKLNTTASSFVKNLELSVDSGLAKLSSFTEAWVTKMNPFVAKTTAVASLPEKATKEKNDFLVGSVSNGEQFKKKHYVGSVPMEKESISNSHKKNSSEKSSSLIFKGEVSVTQASRQSLIGKSSLQLRRSKRERKKSISPKKNTVMKIKRTNNVDENEKGKSLTYKKSKNNKRTMVTPPSRNSNTLTKKFRTRRRKNKNIENKTSKVNKDAVVETNNNRKTRAPEKMVVPSEIMTANEVLVNSPLSQLEEPFQNQKCKKHITSAKKIKSFSKRSNKTPM